MSEDEVVGQPPEERDTSVAVVDPRDAIIAKLDVAWRLAFEAIFANDEAA